MKKILLFLLIFILSLISILSFIIAQDDNFTGSMNMSVIDYYFNESIPINLTYYYNYTLQDIDNIYVVIKDLDNNKLLNLTYNFNYSILRLEKGKYFMNLNIFNGNFSQVGIGLISTLNNTNIKFQNEINIYKSDILRFIPYTGNYIINIFSFLSDNFMIVIFTILAIIVIFLFYKILKHLGRG